MKEQLVEQVEKGKDIIKVTAEKPKGWWVFKSKKIVRLYWNDKLIQQDSDGSRVYPEFWEIMSKLGITKRDLGILPGDWREWTRKEIESVIEAMEC